MNTIKELANEKISQRKIQNCDGRLFKSIKTETNKKTEQGNKFDDCLAGMLETTTENEYHLSEQEIKDNVVTLLYVAFHIPYYLINLIFLG